MDRLTEQQRTAISKMSDERLRVRLVQAGYQEEVVGQLAKYMADEEERTLAAVEVQERTEGENLDDSTETQTQAGATSLEERRLFLEERRFQMEKQRWKAELLSKEKTEEQRLRTEVEFKEKQRQDELLSKEKMEEQRLRVEMEFK